MGWFLVTVSYITNLVLGTHSWSIFLLPPGSLHDSAHVCSLLGVERVQKLGLSLGPRRLHWKTLSYNVVL